MPQNKNAQIRYQVIDRCLRRRHDQWTWRTLAQACDQVLDDGRPDYQPLSRSTIIRDLKHMKRSRPVGYDAPIDWDVQRQSYYYTDPGYVLNNTPIEEEDLHALDNALSILRHFNHFRQVAEVEVLAGRLQQYLRASRRQGPPIVLFSRPDDIPAYRWLDPLYQAIAEKHCLQLHYQPFDQEAIHTIISPYLLKEYNRRWFLLACDHKLHRIQTYALDRIQQAERYLLASYHRLPDFDPQTYFRDIIGVSVPEHGKVEDILLRTTPTRARYLTTKPIHPSLKVVKETTDYTLLSLRLKLNYELESWLLSFGEEVQILQPTHLAATISNRLSKAIQSYSE